MENLSVGERLEYLVGKTLEDVRVTDGGERIIFELSNGETVSFGVDGDCCSRSWIEYLDKPENINGATILSVKDSAPINEIEGLNYSDNQPEYDCLCVYQTHFETDRGTITLEYRNDSNGYYGGYLV